MYTCSVCGYQYLEEPPYDAFGCATYIICPCCGIEFGYDDASIKHSELRQRWKNEGMQWWSPSIHPPLNWNPLEQLQSLENKEAAKGNN